jgi:hypothetical protein
LHFVEDGGLNLVLNILALINQLIYSHQSGVAMEAVKHDLLMIQRSCFTAIPTDSHPVKKEHDYYPPFWVQWAPPTLPHPLELACPN